MEILHEALFTKIIHKLKINNQHMHFTITKNKESFITHFENTYGHTEVSQKQKSKELEADLYSVN